MSAPRPTQQAGRHHHWGLKPYREIHALQQRLVNLRAANEIGNVLLTGEHPPVVTLGRKTPETDTPTPAALDGMDVVEIERGGEATYHGPGQLVVYPIVHLTRARKDLHQFQRDLEEVGLRTLASLGLSGRRRDGLTGVWIDERKVQSLGIAVRRWVTWHGLALNVCTDLAPFRRFRPCGLDGDVMTSIQEARGRPTTVDEVLPILLGHASDILPGGPFLSGALPTA